MERRRTSYALAHLPTPPAANSVTCKRDRLDSVTGRLQSRWYQCWLRNRRIKFMEEDEELDMEVITECMNGELIYDQVEIWSKTINSNSHIYMLINLLCTRHYLFTSTNFIITNNTVCYYTHIRYHPVGPLCLRYTFVLNTQSQCDFHYNL